MDDAGQPDDAVHAAHRDAEALAQRGDRHQAHRHILEDVAVAQVAGRLDAVIARLVLDGVVQVLPVRIVGHFQPFHGGAGADAQRGGHRHAFPVERLQHARHRGRHPVDVELVIAVGGLDPAGIQQGQGRVEDGAHVVHPGVQHVHAVDELRIDRLDGLQHALVADGRQGRQRDGFLDPEDARLGRAIRAAGVNEGLRLGNGHIRRAALVPQHLGKFQRPAGAPRMQDDRSGHP